MDPCEESVVGVLKHHRTVIRVGASGERVSRVRRASESGGVGGPSVCQG